MMTAEKTATVPVHIEGPEARRFRSTTLRVRISESRTLESAIVARIEGETGYEVFGGTLTREATNVHRGQVTRLNWTALLVRWCEDAGAYNPAGTVDVFVRPLDLPEWLTN